ncbi:MAG: hypothetical protein AB4352_05720 [Hormoscilla sp.]
MNLSPMVGLVIGTDDLVHETIAGGPSVARNRVEIADGARRNNRQSLH